MRRVQRPPRVVRRVRRMGERMRPPAPAPARIYEALCQLHMVEKGQKLGSQNPSPSLGGW